jgi:hypothetical protein
VLTFRTNVGDVVEAGKEHPLRFVIHGDNKELKPYLHVRGRLEALVSRAVMYELVDLGEIWTSMASRCSVCAPAARSFLSCRPANWMRCRDDRCVTDRRALYSAAEFRRRALHQMGGPVDLSWRDHGDHILNPEIVARSRRSSCAMPRFWCLSSMTATRRM